MKLFILPQDRYIIYNQEKQLADLKLTSSEIQGFSEVMEYLSKQKTPAAPAPVHFEVVKPDL